MTTEIPVTQARDELAELINRVAYGHERIMLTRHAKPVAGIVPPEDMAWLEQRSREKIDLTSSGTTSHAGPRFAAAAQDEAPPVSAHQAGAPGGGTPGHARSPGRHTGNPPAEA